MAVSGWTMLASFSNVADAPASSSADEPASSIIISSSASSEMSNETPAQPSSAEDRPYVFTDSNKNGIPDEIEDYYDSHIRDQYVFGISLGSVICGALYLFTLIYKWQKDKKFDKATLNKISDLWDAQKATVESSKQYQSIIQDITDKYNKLDAQYQLMVRKFTEQCAQISADLEKKMAENDEKNRQTLEKVTKSIDSYSKVNDKVNVVLENQALMVKNAEYTKSGVNEQVSAKVKEATEDGGKEEN